MQIFVPVTADGSMIRDNGGDVIITCASPNIADRVAKLINADASGELSRSITEGLRVF